MPLMRQVSFLRKLYTIFLPGVSQAVKLCIDPAVKARAASGLLMTFNPTFGHSGCCLFNALPGRLPLIGKLFSPEKGGGLFAWRYSVTGPIGNPDVGINPVSALTPGFLRGLFGIFDQGRGNGGGGAAPR